MSVTSRLLLLASLLAVTSSCKTIQTPSCEAEAASAAAPAGFVPLFNGVNLDGWTARDSGNQDWRVVEGVIDCDPHEGPGDRNLWTTKSYGDFELLVDWRIKESPYVNRAAKIILPDGTYKKDASGKEVLIEVPNTDSGVFLRGQHKSQVNIWCWPVGSGEVWGYRTDPACSSKVHAGVTPKIRADRPIGQWNTFHIVMKGDRLTVTLNGQRVLDQAQLPGIPARGPIALQHHGDRKDGEWGASFLQFRRIFIKELLDTGPLPATTPATGPLRVSTANPRYFANGSGKLVLLTGSHTWGSLQDYAYDKLPSPPAMDFDAYLAFLQRHNHNLFRLWAWESAFNPGAKQGTITYDPMPYQRPGPGLALDGKPRFDLTRFNPAYFDRLRSRVVAARDSGIYASIMLFNGFSVEGKGNVGGDPWQGHPFNPKNNINGVDGGSGTATHTLANPTITAIQETYIRKVIDTINDLDNVLYEITNEDSGGPADTAWQVHMIRFIKAYDASKAKQHPVGMTQQYPQGDEAAMLASPADWISPGSKLFEADGRKVILNDTDHSYFWIGLKQDGVDAQRAWVWENFTRGSQCLFMDPYLDPSHDPGRNDPVGGKPDSYWDTLRDAMGRTRMYAERMNLAAAVPHGELASTGFCLADPGKEYLVYLPQGGEVTVDLSGASGNLNAEWMRPVEGTTIHAEPMAGGRRLTLKAPFPGDAVLYLWSK